MDMNKTSKPLRNMVKHRSGKVHFIPGQVSPVSTTFIAGIFRKILKANNPLLLINTAQFSRLGET